MWLLVSGGESETVLAQVDGATERCSVEDPAPWAVALAALTGGPVPPAQVLVDANGWLRRAFRTEDDASPELVAAELSRIRASPFDGSSIHH